VAYNAEEHIQKVIKRIPKWIVADLAEIYVIDDHSTDGTVDAVKNLGWPEKGTPLHIYKTPFNQGYGGNQRLGYFYAIEKKIDIVILLHGDGQYAGSTGCSMPGLVSNRR